MDAAIASAWRSRVTDDDTVWILGDVGCLDELASLPGTKHLVFGNDDRPRKPFVESGVFETTQTKRTLEIGCGKILLVHDPRSASPDHTRILHGHTHSLPDEPDPRFVSVSVDKTDWGPINLDEVLRRFAARGTAWA